MANSFSDQVKAFTDKVKARQLAVFREAVQRTVDDMQATVKQGGTMPLDTGYLRASIQAHLGRAEIVQTENPDRKAKYKSSTAPVGVVLAQVKLGDGITVGWSANYAIIAEHRTAFARLPIQRWPQTVARVAQEVAARG